MNTFLVNKSSYEWTNSVTRPGQLGRVTSIESPPLLQKLVFTWPSAYNSGKSPAVYRQGHALSHKNTHYGNSPHLQNSDEDPPYSPQPFFDGDGFRFASAYAGSSSNDENLRWWSEFFEFGWSERCCWWRESWIEWKWSWRFEFEFVRVDFALFTEFRSFIPIVIINCDETFI